MFVTTEVRWFYEGARPNDVVAWFQALGPPPDEQAPRTDYYLHPTDAALNVKLREGHAEAKRRDGAVGALVSLADEQTGLIERWHKWSFPLAAGAIGAVATNAYWQPVRKQRWMRVYRVAEDVVEEITDATEGTSGPCTVELSHLTMDGQD